MKVTFTKAVRALCLMLAFGLCVLPLAAQTDDDLFFSSDDDLFGSDVFASDDDLFGGADDGDVFTSTDDIFGESSFADISFGEDDDVFAAWSAGEDDALFDDDGIDVLDESASGGGIAGFEASGFKAGEAGVVFQAGSVKIGGRLSSSVDAGFLLYDEDDDTSFSDRLYKTAISPAISADISLDARPSDTLRMYTKVSLGYPFKSSGNIASGTVLSTSQWVEKMQGIPKFGGSQTLSEAVPLSISDFLKVKEMFTDFSLADRAFFRFGLHTVSWGTGYFFSPCSDMINSGKIDPENADEQVDGSLNLRTQIIFPGSQNCLWLYAIPETGAGALARNTALAAKMDVVVSAFELGFGGFFKYDNAPKAMMTASGSIIDGKVSVFGEGVFQYGADSEWASDTSFDGKSALFKGTAGFSYYWKDPKIMLMGQYYYDGNNKDAMVEMALPSPAGGKFIIPNQMYGHNAALMASFSKLPLLKDCSLSLFGMLNIGRDDLDKTSKMILDSMGNALGVSSKDLAAARATATLNYSPSSSLSFGAGVSASWPDFDSKPVLKATLSATLGGGKF